MMNNLNLTEMEEIQQLWDCGHEPWVISKILEVPLDAVLQCIEEHQDSCIV